MNKVIRVAGYVKLAKLWERARDQAIPLHKKYYAEKYQNNTQMELVDVYIDITGQKQMFKRPEMLRLIRDCELGKIDLIAAQTKGYLAANSQELCYLMKYLASLPNQIDIITEDTNYRINTMRNVDHQREALLQMAEDYIAMDKHAFDVWQEKIRLGISKLSVEEGMTDNG